MAQINGVLAKLSDYDFTVATEEAASSSEELTAFSEEVASTAQNLSEISMNLMETVNRFKV